MAGLRNGNVPTIKKQMKSLIFCSQVCFKPGHFLLFVVPVFTPNFRSLV